MIHWPAGYDVVDAAPAKVGKAKANRVAPASSGGGSRRHAVEKYSSSYTSIALVPDSQWNI